MTYEQRVLEQIQLGRLHSNEIRLGMGLKHGSRYRARIYRALDELVKERYVTCHMSNIPSRPNIRSFNPGFSKMEYRITAKGITALRIAHENSLKV